MTGSPRMALAMLIALASLAEGVPAAAQEGEEDRKMTVMTRPRPELDPLGVRLGSFLLFPSLSVGGAYTDNVFKTDGGRRSDFVFELAPGARLASDWTNHALEIGAEARVGMHVDHGSENYEDVAVWTTGRLDITRATNLFGGFRWEALHEDRGSPDDAAGVRPTEFERLSAHVGASHRFNRVTLEAETRFVQLDFDNVRAGGGGIINNDDRDRDVYLASVKGGYEIVPRYVAFVRGTVNERDYHARVDDFGFNRDSRGYEVVVGTEFDLTGITFGEIHAGYREQFYDDSRFSSVSGVSFGGRLTSAITPLTTLQLMVDREIEETSVTTAEGYWATSVRFTADHELLRNLILSADLAYARSDYQGIDRGDDFYAAGIKAVYQLNRYLGVSAGYRYEERDSSGGARGEDYAENLFLIRLTGRL